MPKAKPFVIPKQLVWDAYQQVKANRGAAGVDGESLAAFEHDLKGNLYKVWNRMSSGAYFRFQQKRQGLTDVSVPYILPYIHREELPMKTTKIFRSGNSQAVRIPKEFQMEGEEVEIHRKGKWLLLRPTQKSWKTLIGSLDKFTDDFMHGGRNQPDLQSRGRAFS